MSLKCIISVLLAPLFVCIIFVPVVVATAEHNLAAGINEQTLKAAAALKNPERLKHWPLRLPHASLHPWKERE